MTMFWKQPDSRITSAEIYAYPGGTNSEGQRGEPGIALRVVPFRAGTRPGHAIIAWGDSPVRVNGQLVIGGFRVLEHKDEILIDSQQLFFSSESPPVVEIYQHSGEARRPRCPVCRGEVLDHQPIVRCPGCARIHHQIDGSADAPAKPCWTYAEQCRFCQHPTSLSGESVWCPAEEDFS